MVSRLLRWVVGWVRVVTEGDQVLLGGNDCYIAMCHKCWQEAIKAQSDI